MYRVWLCRMAELPLLPLQPTLAVCTLPWSFMHYGVGSTGITVLKIAMHMHRALSLVLFWNVGKRVHTITAMARS